MPHTPLSRSVLLALWLGSLTSHAQFVTGLTALDIGAPPLPGSTTVNGSGSFTVAGSGEYKNAASDDFHFAYTNVTGDFDYQVRLEYIDVPSQWSKAGLMAREATDDTVAVDQGSRCLTMTAYPPPPAGGDTFILIRREQTWTPTSDDILGTKPVYPNAWLRMRRLGDTMIGYTGTNGMSWDVQGIHDTVSWPEGPLSPNLLVGLAVASARNNATCTAQFRQFGPVPSTNAVAIAVPLKSVTVNKGRAATFSITVTGYDPFYAQWYTNGTAAGEGANSFSGTVSYTTPLLSLSDDNTTVSVVVSNSVNAVTNPGVLLRVVDDNAAPVVTAATTDNGFIDVIFNEEVSSASAIDVRNYTLNGAAGLSVMDAALSSNQRVATLTLSGIVESTSAALTVARIRDVVGNAATSQIVPLWLALAPSNIVASGYPNDRATAFTSVTDSFVDAGWQTTGDKDHRPQFAGLLYTNAQTFGAIKVDLGEQNEYGGSFAVEPKLYLLKNNVDTDIAGPETDPANWQQVAASLVSPNLFDANVDPNPSPASPIIFDLSALSPSARAAYGWAVGGVSGDNSGFIRITELRGYGVPGGEILQTLPTLTVTRTPAQAVAISWPSTATGFLLKSSASLDPDSWSLVADSPQLQGTNFTLTVESTNAARFYRLEK